MTFKYPFRVVYGQFFFYFHAFSDLFHFVLGHLDIGLSNFIDQCSSKFVPDIYVDSKIIPKLITNYCDLLFVKILNAWQLSTIIRSIIDKYLTKAM
jgi:hypothetical protein